MYWDICGRIVIQKSEKCTLSLYLSLRISETKGILKHFLFERGFHDRLIEMEVQIPMALEKDKSFGDNRSSESPGCN